MDILPSNTPQKQCTGPCGRTLPVTIEYFHRNGKSGLHTQCKACRSIRNKEKYRKPEEHERALAYRKTYREQNKELVKEQYKAWSAKPETKEYKRNYTRIYRTRPEAIEKRHEEYRKYIAKPEVKARYLEYEREYLQRPEKRARHQERDRANHHTRRSRIREVQGTHTPEQIQEQLKRQKYKCYYAACGHAKFEKRAGKYVYHVDHTFPLSRVTHSDIPANSIDYLVLSCPHCNMSKNDKLPWEWPEGGRLL